MLRKILILMAFFVIFQNTAFATEIGKSDNIDTISDIGVCVKDEHMYYHVRKLNHNTYAIMESLHYSSQQPIAYLFMGKNKDLLLDTGQKLKNHNDSEISNIVFNLIKNWHKQYHVKTHPLLVMHSHCHYDHIGGDIGFKDRKNVIFLAPGKPSLENFFKFHGGIASYNLGDREIILLLSPGHTSDSVAIYDSESKMLFTTDILYHGVIFVGDYKKYKKSLQQWLVFSKTNIISHLIGNHYPYYGFSKCNKNEVFIPGKKDLFFSKNDLKDIIYDLLDSLKPYKAIANKIVLIPLDFPCSIDESSYLSILSLQKQKAYFNLLDKAGSIYDALNK